MCMRRKYRKRKENENAEEKEETIIKVFYPFSLFMDCLDILFLISVFLTKSWEKGNY